MKYPIIPAGWSPDPNASTYSPVVRRSYSTFDSGGNKCTVPELRAAEVYPTSWFTNTQYCYHPMAEEMREHYLSFYSSSDSTSA